MGSAGISDITMRLGLMREVAAAYGCAAVVPKPYESLTSDHNAGIELNPALWWSRYYELGPGSEWHVLRSLPYSDSGIGETRVARTPDVQFMQQWYERIVPGKMQVLVIEFKSAKLSSFWCPSRGCVSGALKRIAANGPMARTRKPGLWPNHSAEIISRARVLAQQLFGGALFLGVHIRRGDRLHEYPQGCADVPAILWNIQNMRHNMEKKLGPVLGVYIMTDETSASFLQSLRRDLLVFFKYVHFEEDIPANMLHPEDNYFTFLLSSTLARTHVWYLEYHPSVVTAPDADEGIRCSLQQRLSRPFPSPPPPSPRLPPTRPPPTWPQLPRTPLLTSPPWSTPRSARPSSSPQPLSMSIPPPPPTDSSPSAPLAPVLLRHQAPDLPVPSPTQPYDGPGLLPILPVDRHETNSLMHDRLDTVSSLQFVGAMLITAGGLPLLLFVLCLCCRRLSRLYHKAGKIHGAEAADEEGVSTAVATGEAFQLIPENEMTFSL